MGAENKARRFSARFDLTNEEHRIAWEKLSEVPNGKRNEFIMQAILEKTDSHPLKTIMEKMYKSLESRIQPTDEKDTAIKDNDEISKNVLDFMKGL
jgi:hypothetical protein